MKISILVFIIVNCISCFSNTNYGVKVPKEEHIVVEVNEKTDSLTKVFRPNMKNINSLRIIMKGNWNDTINLMDSLMPAKTVDHNGVQQYSDDRIPTRWSFKKYKATKYYIKLEYIFSEEYFTSYKDNY
jgi:hypothetical protein